MQAGDCSVTRTPVSTGSSGQRQKGTAGRGWVCSGAELTAGHLPGTVWRDPCLSLPRRSPWLSLPCACPLAGSLNASGTSAVCLCRVKTKGLTLPCEQLPVPCSAQEELRMANASEHKQISFLPSSLICLQCQALESPRRPPAAPLKDLDFLEQ